MMQSLNSGLSGRFFKSLLIVMLFGAVGGLVFTDIGGYFRNGGVSRTDVARVGDEEIGLADFSNTFRRALAQSGIPEEQALQMGVPYMVLQQEITDRVLRQAARDSGIRISNAHVASELRKQLAQVQLPGSNKDKLDAILQQQDTTETEFVNRLRNNFAVSLLASAVASSDQEVPEMLADSAYRYERQKRTAHVIQISEADVKNKPRLDDKALEEFYKENVERYRTAEKRDIAFVVLKQSEIMPDVTVSDAEAESFYKDHTNQFTNPERVRLSQIILKDEKAAKDLVATKPASLDKVRLSNGDYLAADWYSRPALNKTMQDALYPAKTLGLVGPLQTEMGWHVLMVEKYDDVTVKNFDSVKDIIVRELKDRQLDEKLNGVTEQIETLASSNPSLDAIAHEYKTSVQKISDLDMPNVAQKMKSAGVADAVAARLNEAAFSLDENEISPIMDTKDGDMVLAQVTKTTPSAVPAFAQIKEQIRKDAEKQALRDAVDDLGTQAIRSFDSNKPDEWEKKVAAMGLSVENNAALDRNGAVQKMGNEAANLLFTLTPESRISSLPNDKGVLVIKLQDIIPYDGIIDNGALAHAGTRIKGEVAQEIQQEFVAGWRNRLGVGVNDALIQQYFAAKAK